MTQNHCWSSGGAVRIPTHSLRRRENGIQVSAGKWKVKSENKRDFKLLNYGLWNQVNRIYTVNRASKPYISIQFIALLDLDTYVN